MSDVCSLSEKPIIICGTRLTIFSQTVSWRCRINTLKSSPSPFLVSFPTKNYRILCRVTSHPFDNVGSRTSKIHSFCETAHCGVQTVTSQLKHCNLRNENRRAVSVVATFEDRENLYGHFVSVSLRKQQISITTG